MDPDVRLAVEAAELDVLLPRFYDAEEAGIEPFLGPARTLGDPKGVTYTLPEVLDIWFETYTGAEPMLNFQDFVKGAACAAYAVDPAELGAVKQVIQELARQVNDGAGLPRLDARFADSIRQGLATIFANGEAVSWRPLVAFTLGAYWLLGFIERAAASEESAARGFVEAFTRHFGALGYTPQ